MLSSISSFIQQNLKYFGYSRYPTFTDDWHEGPTNYNHRRFVWWFEIQLTLIRWILDKKQKAFLKATSKMKLYNPFYQYQVNELLGLRRPQSTEHAIAKIMKCRKMWMSLKPWNSDQPFYGTIKLTANNMSKKCTQFVIFFVSLCFGNRSVYIYS